MKKKAIIVYFLLILISFVAVRRLVLLSAGAAAPNGPSPFPQHEFSKHATLTTVHIVSGLVFLVVGITQFYHRLRTARPKWHRRAGRVLIILAAVNGITAVWMGFVMPIGGVSETSAVTLFGITFVYCAYRAFIHIRNKNVTLHREWIIRAYSMALSVATTRIITGLFFATQSVTGLHVEDFFGTALWIGFTLHYMAADYWIKQTKGRGFHPSI